MGALGQWGGPAPLSPRAVPELCLCPQLRDLQEKYAECGGMLQEAQKEVKSLRNRSLPNSTVSRYGGPSLLPVVSGGHGREGWGALLSPLLTLGPPHLQDSLAAEIKGTMRKGTDSSSSDYKWVLPSVAGAGPGGGVGGSLGAGSRVHPCLSPARRSYLRVFETVKAVNQAAKAKSCSESPHHVPGSKQMSAAPSAGANTPPTSCSVSEGAQ